MNSKTADMLEEFDDIGKDTSPHCQIPRNFPSKNKFVSKAAVSSLNQVPSMKSFDTPARVDVNIMQTAGKMLTRQASLGRSS